jgi:hypothetical protein
MKKICVVNFWEGAFDGDFLEYFFSACCNGITYTNDPHEADLVVTSVFGNVHTDPKKTIAFIGENIRPSYVGYDYSLSFDFDSYGGRNHRLPLWYARLEWPDFVQRPRKQNAHNHGYEPLIKIAPLTQSRRLDWQEKKEFCAMIAGNPEGLRVNLYNYISRYKPVHGYGNMFNRALHQSKFDVLKNYKFCLCPENSVYDGYVTEKLLDAYAGGTIPIYSGTMSVDCDFHEGAYLNYMDTKDMDWFVTAIQAIDESKEIYEDMYNRPLLWEPPSLDNAIAFVRNIVK